MALSKVQMEGKTFGDLTVIGPADGPNWLCRCVCGSRIRVTGVVLRSPKGRRSCGCKSGRRPR